MSSVKENSEQGNDDRWMRRALELARRGFGYVEPNPMVGCVLVKEGRSIGEGWHRKYGEAHAEVMAIDSASESTSGATCYVTLEPCCHHGKTPPCTGALTDAGIAEVVVACLDPDPRNSGQGMSELRSAGIDVRTGVQAQSGEALVAPFRKLLTQNSPWMIAKWAMTLDGKLATASGDSKWISGTASRQRVHEMRGAMDAILIGIGTALADDPLLTARPAGQRRATRIVLDRNARLPLESQLVQTAHECPVLVVVTDLADEQKIDDLKRADCEVLIAAEQTKEGIWRQLLIEMGSRCWTNVMIEGGSEVLGTCFDLAIVDEVHVFIANKIAGGAHSGPVDGVGHGLMADADQLESCQVETIDEDLYISGRIVRPDACLRESVDQAEQSRPSDASS